MGVGILGLISWKVRCSGTGHDGMVKIIPVIFLSLTIVSQVPALGDSIRQRLTGSFLIKIVLLKIGQPSEIYLDGKGTV